MRHSAVLLVPSTGSIKILPPAEPQKKCYINRKVFPSVILQDICDAKGAFLDVYIGNPGSVRDALVLQRSPMYKENQYPPAGFFLLGGGGYPCLPVAVITPGASKNTLSVSLNTQKITTLLTFKHTRHFIHTF